MSEPTTEDVINKFPRGTQTLATIFLIVPAMVVLSVISVFKRPS